MYENPGKFGLMNIRVQDFNRAIFNVSADLSKTTNWFDFDSKEPGASTNTLRALDAAVNEWKKASARGASLYYKLESSGGLSLFDTRFQSSPTTKTIDSSEAEIFSLAGLRISTAFLVKKELAKKGSLSLTEKGISEALDGFVREGLAVKEGNKYLTLAMPQNMECFEETRSSHLSWINQNRASMDKD